MNDVYPLFAIDLRLNTIQPQKNVLFATKINISGKKDVVNFIIKTI